MRHPAVPTSAAAACRAPRGGCAEPLLAFELAWAPSMPSCDLEPVCVLILSAGTSCGCLSMLVLAQPVHDPPARSGCRCLADMATAWHDRELRNRSTEACSTPSVTPCPPPLRDSCSLHAHPVSASPSQVLPRHRLPAVHGSGHDDRVGGARVRAGAVGHDRGAVHPAGEGHDAGLHGAPTLPALPMLQRRSMSAGQVASGATKPSLSQPVSAAGLGAAAAGRQALRPCAETEKVLRQAVVCTTASTSPVLDLLAASHASAACTIAAPHAAIT